MFHDIRYLNIFYDLVGILHKVIAAWLHDSLRFGLRWDCSWFVLVGISCIGWDEAQLGSCSCPLQKCRRHPSVDALTFSDREIVHRWSEDLDYMLDVNEMTWCRTWCGEIWQRGERVSSRRLPKYQEVGNVCMISSFGAGNVIVEMVDVSLVRMDCWSYKIILRKQSPLPSAR